MSNASRFIVLLLSVLMLSQMLPSCSSTSPPDDDLFITSIEPIQVVGNPRGIIINKSTTLRLEVVSTFPNTVYSDFRITYDFGRETYIEEGPDGNGVPLVPGTNKVYVPGGNCTGHFSGWWSYPLTFIWTSLGTDSAVTVEVDPLDRVDEQDETNNVKAIDAPIQVVYAAPMRILVIPIKKPGQSYEYDLDENIRALRDLYPLADDGIVVVEAPWETRSYTTKQEAKQIARSYSADARALGYDRVIVIFKEIIEGGWELYGSAVGMLREPEDRVPFLATASGLEDSEDLLAHELGHTYYLWHPHDIGFPEYNATIWRCFYREYESRASTTMSYDWLLPAGVPSHVRWMDEQRYQSYPKSWIDLSDEDYVEVDGVWEWNLYEQFVTRPPIRIPSVVISGMIYINGSVLLNHTFYHLAEGVIDIPAAAGMQTPGDYSIRLLNAAESVIGNYAFNVSFTEYTQWDESTEVWEEEVDEVSFVFNVPDMPATKYVQIVNDTGSVLAERVVSDHSPSIQIASPNGGEEIGVGEACEITWTADDQDGDPLTFMLAYSSDYGEMWVPIEDGVTTDHYSWNTTGIPPGEDYLIKVIASDGYKTAEDVSDATFSVYDDAPPATMLTLEGIEGQNGWFVSDVNVSLTATDNYRVNRSEYSYDGTTWINYTGTFAVVDEGNTTLRYRSVDEEGNVEDDKIAIVPIDKTKPQILIQGITDGSVIKTENLTIGWTSSDSISGIDIFGCKIRSDGGTWQEGGYEGQCSFFGLEQGTHTFEVMAFDNAGNSNTSVVEFTVEKNQWPEVDALLIAGMIVVVAIITAGLYVLLRKKT
ncbi:MAG: GPI anchored serine-threonine rich family protein [Methanomassiliicoccales archaeon]|nr:GPI anchored serine-threonine rich family protein [Methanomassiliicoccales archaeon]